MPTAVHSRSEIVEPSAGGKRMARILLVEDDAVNRLVAIQLLLQLGHRAEVVGGGRDALAALAADRYDLVLMDCQMAEMDGYEATIEVRRREAGWRANGRLERRVPIVAMTASSTGEDLVRCLAAGMDDRLAKPYRLRQLDEVLRRWLWAGLAEPPPWLLDTAVLRALSGDGERIGLLREVVDVFRSDGAARLAVIREALGRGDTELTRQAVHALRGSGAMIGALLVERICGWLEDGCRERDPLALPELVGRLEDALADTGTALDELLASI